MNVYDVSYKIKSKDNGKYILISDLHGNFNKDIAQYIRDKEDVKYVLISGDLLNGSQWTNKVILKELKEFLNIIKENHKIIVSLGNHDIFNIDDKGFKNYKDLECENIIPLFNEVYIDDNNRFTSFVPELNTYSYPKQDSSRTLETILKNYESLNKVSSNSKFIEHLLSHNPYHFYHKEVNELISKKYDLIETGHFHDGWIPTKYVDKHYDLVKDKNIQELVRHYLLLKNKDKISLTYKRILGRGVAYIYKDGYYVLLPNDNIYYYNKSINQYSITSKAMLESRLKQQKSTPLIICGAINGFFNLKVFYPYITNIELVKDDVYEASRCIKKI